MVRRNPLTMLFTLMAAAAIVGTPVGMEAAAPGGAVSTQSASKGKAIVPSTRHACLVYASNLTPDEVLARAAADAQALGLPMVKTLGCANIVVVQATVDEARARLNAAEGLPIASVAPTYLGDGDPHPLSMMAFTGRVQVTFSESAREADKQRFYAANGLTLVYESSTGAALLETGRQPDASLIPFAENLLTAPGVARAIPEIAFTGEPTAVGSAEQISDPYFGLQWPLYADGQNTNYGFGRADADIDAPRAWMINKSLGNSTYGNSAISVAVFDSGTERTHPDLATSLDPQIGRDQVDGSFPDPVRNTLGAHGTAMASIVAGAANSSGMIGVAPGVKIYTSRVFASDYSTTNARLVAALGDTISNGVDVNLHPYVLPVACTAELLVGEVEQALRQTFLAGRSGVGVVNVAAGGNFFSQTEYPATSAYTIAVGAHSAEDNRIEQANWGGLGVDIVMPSYRIFQNNGGDETYGTGVIAADLSGPEGFAGTTPSIAGNANQQWGALGNILTFPRTAAATSSSFLGTSVSAAYAAGAAALLLSDERYTCLPPLIETENNSRQQRRNRRAAVDAVKSTATKAVSDPAFCPPREAGDNILLVMTSHNEHPSVTRGSAPATQYFTDCGFSIPDVAVGSTVAYEYFDLRNEVMGYGRFNPARALYANPRPTHDTAIKAQFNTPLISYQFGATGNAGDELDEEIRPSLTGGWRARGDADGNGFQTITIDEETGDEIVQEPFGDWILAGRGGIIVSPYLEPLDRILLETGEEIVNEEGGSVFAWTDSFPTGAGPELQVADNVIYNPRGAYKANTKIELEGPKEPFAGTPGLPGLASIQIGFELGVQNASSSTQLSISQELDRLALLVTYFSSEGKPTTYTVYSFTGDTLEESKKRLCAADSRVDITQAPIEGNFPLWSGVYDVSVASDEMPVRTFEFLLPPAPEDTAEFQFALRLSPGVSWLPTYRTSSSGVPEQMYNVFRDHGGFVFYGLSARLMDPSMAQVLEKRDFVLNATGNIPTFSTSGNEVLFSTNVGQFTLSSAEARGTYLGFDRAEPSETVDYRAAGLMALTSQMTGLKANPVRDQVAITTADGKLYTATGDGVNLRLIATEAGVRDPSWAPAGDTLIYATPTAIKAIVFQSSGSFTSETIMEAGNATLTDFRTPVLDYDGGIVYFTAVVQGESPAVRRIYVASRSGRVINVSGEDSRALLAGWTNVDMYDLDLSQSGRRLIFVGNARRAPRIAADGTVETETSASTDRRIFIVENINAVAKARNIPIYDARAPFAGTVQPRYPRLSYNDSANNPRLVYTALSARNEISSYAESGSQVVLVLSKENTACATDPPDPTPAPSVTPVPSNTPAPIDTALVAQMSESTFESTVEGWSFGSAAPTYNAPTQGYVRGSTGTPRVDGSLQLITNGNNTTFGFWGSPSPAFSVIADSLYLVRARVRATDGVSAEQTPTMRLRANSGTNEHAGLIVTNSQGDLSLAPSGTVSRTQDLLLAPPVEQLLATDERRAYSMSFDMVNFSDGDTSTGGLRLEQVEVFRLDHAPKHFSLWCFEVPTGGAQVSLTVSGASDRLTPLYLELRSCCAEPDTAADCAAGTVANGATLSFANLAAGRYTLVAAATRQENLTLSYNSNATLIAACPSCVTTTKEEQFTSVITICETSTTISGLSGTSSVGTFYDGTGLFPTPACDPTATNTVVKGAELIYSNSMDSEAERAQWTTGGAPGFTLPTFGNTETGLSLWFQNRQDIGFGFWVLDGTDIPLPTPASSDNGPFIYRATVLLSSQLPLADKNNSPVVRVRLATSDFQRIAEAVVEPGINQNIVPVAGRPIQLELYLVLPAKPTTADNLIFAVDLIDSFPTRAASSAPVVIEDLKIERLTIPNYPEIP